jgi:hypothetical protein
MIRMSLQPDAGEALAGLVDQHPKELTIGRLAPQRDHAREHDQRGQDNADRAVLRVLHQIQP